MGFLPGAIVFVNNDLTSQVQAHLVKQLHISEVIDGYVFDDRVTANSDYPTTVRNQKLRLMVVRSFEETENRDLADVVIFVKAGLAAIEQNGFGPHGLTFPILNLYWQKLGVF